MGITDYAAQPVQDASGYATAEPIYEPEPVYDQMQTYEEQPAYDAQGTAYAEQGYQEPYYEPAPAFQEPDYQAYEESQLVDPMGNNYGQSEQYPGLDYVQEADLNQSLANIDAQYQAGNIDLDTANANAQAAYAQISGQAAAAERDILRFESERDTGVEYPNLRARAIAEGAYDNRTFPVAQRLQEQIGDI